MLAASAAVLAALGCGEVSTPAPVGGGSAGMGGVSGEGGAAGAAQGGRAAGGNDVQPELDAGIRDTGSDPPDFMYPPGCPVPAPIPVVGQVIAIQSVNFDTSEIVIRNVSGSAFTIDGGEQGWQWCNFPSAYDLVVGNDVTLEPDQTLAFRLIYQGRLRPLFNPGEPGDANELGIYDSPGGFMNAERMVTFVSWVPGVAAGRESVASTAGWWVYGDRIEIDAGDAGFIVTGRTDRGDGYTSVPARCLVAPPNPPGTELPEPE